MSPLKIKISRRTLAALEAAYVVTVVYREIGEEPLGLLLHEHAVELRDRLCEMLEKKEKKKYTLELSRSEAAALHFYWIDQPIHSHDAGQAVNALLAAIDRYRKSPSNDKFIPEIL